MECLICDEEIKKGGGEGCQNTYILNFKLHLVF